MYLGTENYSVFLTEIFCSITNQVYTRENCLLLLLLSHNEHAQREASLLCPGSFQLLPIAQGHLGMVQTGCIRGTGASKQSSEEKADKALAGGLD